MAEPKGGPNHRDAVDHVLGRTRYVDDMPAPFGLLHAAVLASPVAHGHLRGLDVSAALAIPGVVAILQASDIPGENQIGAVIPDEPLLAENELHFRGQPLALVCAESWETARLALAAIRVDYEELEPLLDPKQAYLRGEIIGEPRQVACGDVDQAWGRCSLVLEGCCKIGGQEHVYLETQRARAWLADGGIHILSSTQGPYAVQRAASRVLGLPMHQVVVEVGKLGGGFGGKEDQASAWGALVALATWRLQRPVELVLSRADDLMMTGKRHPYHSEWKIGVEPDGKILAFEVQHYQNAGAACDLSLGVLGRTLVHATGSYAIPNARIWGASCRTHLPPFTAFRGFGGPQGMLVIESAIAAVAEALDLPREAVQRRNLLREGDALPYGQKVESCAAGTTFDRLATRVDLEALRHRTEAFNASSFHLKKGYALMPVCFGISFGATFLNQAGALVHVYTDGSVSISTGGVEMGQGLNTNLAVVAASTLGIALERVRVESTETRRIANMSASAASSTTLLNGNAVQGACREILQGLMAFAARELEVAVEGLRLEGERLWSGGADTGWDWPQLVAAAYRGRVALSAHHFYATPGLHFDVEKQQGHPFAYHVYGASLIEVTVDCLRGRYQIDKVSIVHDLGRPLARAIDLGQIEGALAQGIGWLTLEELRFDERGRLASKALASYKVPDADFLPDVIDIEFLEDRPSATGPLGSKAVGEPPLMYGIAAYFAIRQAVRAFRLGLGDPAKDLPFETPYTPERVLMQSHRRISPTAFGRAREIVAETTG